MAERPFDLQNWQGRNFQSFGPKFRLDMANPQMGLNGTDVYNLYAVTDNKNVCINGLSEGGVYKIYNDGPIEFIAGQKSKSTGVDIVIVGKNGDITITAEKNGKVKIRASKITIDADESVDIVAGKNVNIRAGKELSIKANTANLDALEGNMPPQATTFGGITFAGTYVDSNLVKSTFTGGSGNEGGTETCGGFEPPAGQENLAKKDDEDLLSAKNTTLTGNETAGTVSTGGPASGGALAE